MSEVAIYRAMLESPTDPQIHRPEGPSLVVRLADYDALRARVAELEGERDAQAIVLAKIWVKLRALVGDVDYALNGDAGNKTED